MITYRHTQFGTVFAVAAGVIVLIGALPVLLAGTPAVAGLIAILLLGVLLLFHKLTVEIDDAHLRLRFGIGLIRKRFPLDEIDSCQPVRNSWLYGWGIRLTPRGWLYNVSGLDAVELTMMNGKTCRIGTDEPRVLAAAVQEALAKSIPATE